MAQNRYAGRLACAAAVALASCSPPAEKAAPPAPPPVAAPMVPALPVAPPSVDRAELLEAVAEAAAAFATGRSQEKTATALAGRRFSVRLPFGCQGPRPQASLGYSYDEKSEALKVSATPLQWGEVAPVRSLVGTAQTEAIEGFWVERPWIPSADCPVAATDAPTATPVPPVTTAAPINTIGLVSVFEKGGSRLLRRGTRPYEVVLKAPPPTAGGLRLVLEGRVIASPDGRTIFCRSENLDQPPICLVRVEFDRVAIEGATGEGIGEWRN